MKRGNRVIKEKGRKREIERDRKRDVNKSGVRRGGRLNKYKKEKGDG